MAKKLISCLLAIMMLAGVTCVSAFAADVPPEGAAVSNSTVAPRWFRSYINANYVRLRSGPGTSYTALGQLQKNDTVEPDADTDPVTDSEGTVWRYIYSERHECYGWVAARYISNEGM